MKPDFSTFLQVTQLCAEDRNLPFKADVNLWAIRESREIINRDVYIAAEKHKVIHSVYRVLNKRSNCQIPDGFRRAHVITASMQAMMASRWQLLAQSLEKDGIEALVIKGPALSAQLYGDASIRGFTDLDVLVTAQKLSSCLHALKDAGYTTTYDSEAIQQRYPFFYRHFVQKQARHLVMISSQSPLRVEVHNRFLDFPVKGMDRELSSEFLFNRSEYVLWNEIKTRTLALPDHVLFMIDHGTRHGWALLHWALDAAAFLALDDKKLHEEVAHLVRRTKRERQLTLMIALVQSLFAIQVPEPYLYLGKKQTTVHRLLLTYTQRNLASGGAHSCASIFHVVVFQYGYQWLMATSWRQRWALLLRPLQVPAVDVQRVNLPRPLVFLHLIMRPYWMMQRHRNHPPTIQKH